METFVFKFERICLELQEYSVGEYTVTSESYNSALLEFHKKLDSWNRDNPYWKYCSI